MNAEGQPFQSKEESCLFLPVPAQLNLSARKLFHHPGPGFSYGAFLLAQACDQFLERFLVRFYFASQIGEEPFEWFPLVGVDQAVEQFQCAHGARQMVVQINAQAFHTCLRSFSSPFLLLLPEGFLPIQHNSVLKAAHNPR